MDHLEKLVHTSFTRTVDAAEVNIELKRAVKEHPKVKQFLKDLYLQLVNVNVNREFRQKARLKDKTVIDTVESFAKVFIKGVNHEAEKRVQSELEKIRQKALADKQRDLEKSASGELSGEYLEIAEEGVILNETGSETASETRSTNIL